MGINIEINWIFWESNMTKTVTNMTPSVKLSEADTINYAVNSMLCNVNTILPCKIIAVNSLRYDIQPLLNNLDFIGAPYAPPIIYNVPAMDIAGNGAGVIIEYIVGDVVAVGFSQRDMTSIKSTWTLQNPNSRRKFDLADALIISRLSNTAPTIYVKITTAGITLEGVSTPIIINTTGDATVNGDNININASSEANITAPTINLNGAVIASSTMAVGGGLSAPSASINDKDFATHTHSPGSYSNSGGSVTGVSGSVS
jgi:hypothetical protein